MDRRTYLSIGVSLALVMGCAVSVHAAQSVWSGLVIANNVEEPEEIPAELNRIEGELKALFGYNQFKIIGQTTKTLVTGSEDWVASSKYFALRVNSKGETHNGYLLDLKLLQENKVLLETEATLSQHPLVIKGPQIGSGQLLLVLVMQ